MGFDFHFYQIHFSTYFLQKYDFQVLFTALALTESS